MPAPAPLTAATFAPTWKRADRSLAPRGGALFLDIDFTRGGIGIDAVGGLALVRGQDRLISRIIRALLTERGSWWAEPNYGSDAVEGASLVDNVGLQVSECVLYETRRYSQRQLPPNEQVGAVQVHTVVLASDARSVQIDVTLFPKSGPSFRAVIPAVAS